VPPPRRLRRAGATVGILAVHASNSLSHLPLHHAIQVSKQSMAIYLVLLVSAGLVSATAADVGGEAFSDGVAPEDRAGRKLLARYRCNARKDMAIFDNDYAYFPTGYLKNAKAKTSTDCCNKCINNSKCWQVHAVRACLCRLLSCNCCCIAAAAARAAILLPPLPLLMLPPPPLLPPPLLMLPPPPPLLPPPPLPLLPPPLLLLLLLLLFLLLYWAQLSSRNDACPAAGSGCSLPTVPTRFAPCTTGVQRSGPPASSPPLWAGARFLQESSPCTEPPKQPGCA
jgi:hypothetical protein